MTEKLEIYKCNVCGNITEVLVPESGTLVCCGEDMELLKPMNHESEKTIAEKHTPEIEHTDNGTIIRMPNHPMEEKHYIVFLRAEDSENNNVYTKFFYPNDKVEMVLEGVFNIKNAVSYCNVHGLYEGEINE